MIHPKVEKRSSLPEYIRGLAIKHNTVESRMKNHPITEHRPWKNIFLKPLYFHGNEPSTTDHPSLKSTLRDSVVTTDPPEKKPVSGNNRQVVVREARRPSKGKERDHSRASSAVIKTIALGPRSASTPSVTILSPLERCLGLWGLKALLFDF